MKHAAVGHLGKFMDGMDLSCSVASYRKKMAKKEGIGSINLDPH